jgi:hypothetical protein
MSEAGLLGRFAEKHYATAVTAVIGLNSGFSGAQRVQRQRGQPGGLCLSGWFGGALSLQPIPES